MRCTKKDANGNLIAPKPFVPAVPKQHDGTCPPNESGFTEGVRFVRLKGTKQQSNYLQISQVVVNDVDGKNVALKKPASLSSRDPGSSGGPGKDVDPNWAVDGLLNVRCGWPNDRVTIINYYPADPDPWWMVDLQEDFSIKQVYYYNRGLNCWGFRAQGVQVQLLDSEKRVIKEYVMSSQRDIYCINTI